MTKHQTPFKNISSQKPPTIIYFWYIQREKRETHIATDIITDSHLGYDIQPHSLMTNTHIHADVSLYLNTYINFKLKSSIFFHSWLICCMYILMFLLLYTLFFSEKTFIVAIHLRAAVYVTQVHFSLFWIVFFFNFFFLHNLK